jgi:hypothetical protein
MRFLTGIDPQRKATIIRLVGRIRDFTPELTCETVLDATASARLFPSPLSNAHSAEIDLDLRQVGNPGSPTYFARRADDIDVLLARMDDGLRREEIKRLAVFAFTRVPLFIHFGGESGCRSADDVRERYADGEGV